MTVARQAALFMEFSRQKYWSGLSFPSPEDLPDPGIKPASPALQADSLPLSHPRSPSVSTDGTNILLVSKLRDLGPDFGLLTLHFHLPTFSQHHRLLMTSQQHLNLILSLFQGLFPSYLNYNSAGWPPCFQLPCSLVNSQKIPLLPGHNDLLLTPESK